MASSAPSCHSSTRYCHSLSLLLLLLLLLLLFPYHHYQSYKIITHSHHHDHLWRAGKTTRSKSTPLQPGSERFLFKTFSLKNAWLGYVDLFLLATTLLQGFVKARLAMFDKPTPKPSRKLVSGATTFVHLPPCTKINQIQIGQISWYAKENWERSSHRRQQQRRREEERMQIQPKRPQEPQSLNFTRPCPSFRSRAMVSLHCQHFNKTVLGQFFTAKIGNFYPFESHKVTIAYSFSH